MRGVALTNLRADMERNYPVLRQTSYGKQVIAIEKLLFGNNPPPIPPPKSGASSLNSIFPYTNPSSNGDTDATSVHPAEVK